LSAVLRVAKGGEVSAADEKLELWLESQKATRSAEMHLHLDGRRVDDFLSAIIDHPRVRCANSPDALQISKGGRVVVKEAQAAEGVVRLLADESEWFELGEAYWRVGEWGLERLGDGAMPHAVAKVIQGLACRPSIELPMREFLDRIGLLQNWLELPETGWLGALHFVPARFEVGLKLDGSLARVEAELSLRYATGDGVFPLAGEVEDLPRLADERCEVRDLAGEAKVLEAMAAAGFEFPMAGRAVLAGEAAVIEFLSRVLPKWRGAWKIGESANFKLAREKVVLVSPRIEIRGSGDDWLNFDLSYESDDGARIPAAEIQRMLRSGAGVEKRSDGRRVVLSDEIADLIDPLMGELDVRQEGGHYEARGVSADVVMALAGNFSKSGVAQSAAMEPLQMPSTLMAEPRPYQSTGVTWMADRVRRFGGALLADDMGLGKTLQAIAVIEHLFETKSDESGLVLVVATASLLGNWRAEFARFAPKRRVVVLHGAGRESLRDGLRDGDVVITSYGTLARDLVWHLGREYHAVVVDEASLMRNPDTDHARALFKLRSKARIALTGTPLENGVGDLWSIFRFVQPGWLGSRDAFKERYETPLRAVGGDAQVMERLRLRLKPLMLRRSKEQVAPDLPSKLIIDEWCELTDQQKSVYRDLQVEGRKLVQFAGDSGNAASVRMRMLTALLRLRQACCDLALLGSERLKQLLASDRSIKMQRLFELLEEAIAGNHKVLIFSQFQKQLLEIEKHIHERQWSCLRLDGQTRNRQALVDKFQSADGPPVFLISLKAGGYGLNLTAADVVIHFDPWWNPAAEAQATDRAHRIGQTRPVTVYRLLTRGTVEEKVVRMQAGKRELAAGLDEEGGGDGGLTAAEMRSVLAGD
jgi:superfamily II DNA or RNA helicase